MADQDRPTLPRNGCHNRAPLQTSTWVQDGWTQALSDYDRSRRRIGVLREIPDPMSKDCQYSRTTADERCDGCKWRQALE